MQGLAGELPEPRYEAGQDAVDRALGSEDIVGRILARLPVPTVLLGRVAFGKRDSKTRPKDRWAAAAVNRVWRRAALSLPWRARLAGSDQPSVQAVTALCRPRRLESLTVELGKDSMAQCAAAVSCASGVRSFDIILCDVRDGREDCLPDWLQHTVQPFRPAQPPASNPPQAMTVRACLASLSRLTSLRVLPANPQASWVWTDASWVPALRHLQHLHIGEYAGVPLGGLPHLKTLSAVLPAGGGIASRLEQWASPQLVCLRLKNGKGLLQGPTISSEPAQGSGVAAMPDSRAWLRGLKWLVLAQYQVDPHDIELRDLTPHLTSLGMYCQYRREHGTCHSDVLAQGLPLSLQELSVKTDTCVQPDLLSAVCCLTNLVCLNVEQGGEFSAEGELQAWVRGLSALPRLSDVDMTWNHLTFRAEEERRLRTGFKGLQTLLASRGGSLCLLFRETWPSYGWLGLWPS